MLVGLLVEADDDPTLQEMLIENSLFVRGLLARGLGLDENDPDVELVQATLWGLALMHRLFRGKRPDDWADAHFGRLHDSLETSGAKRRERADDAAATSATKQPSRWGRTTPRRKS